MSFSPLIVVRSQLLFFYLNIVFCPAIRTNKKLSMTSFDGYLMYCAISIPAKIEFARISFHWRIMPVDGEEEEKN